MFSKRKAIQSKRAVSARDVKVVFSIRDKRNRDCVKKIRRCDNGEKIRSMP